MAAGGVAINPHTNVQLLEDVIQQTDLVCMMSVNPGTVGKPLLKILTGKLDR